ncbi:hypothetical protein BUALT_Bualt15G0122500 [Buddleja alternifolia]|uniref:Transmembrane protein n=1 Tax=Buddleja alternifolia TaxID=168488 RepID=A0AAV6WD12_9LAMI|nr:hypothetical protein BUALT_Bualt15G0122500 [Buddleja alternifolia]
MFGANVRGPIILFEFGPLGRTIFQGGGCFACKKYKIKGYYTGITKGEEQAGVGDCEVEVTKLEIEDFAWVVFFLWGCLLIVWIAATVKGKGKEGGDYNLKKCKQALKFLEDAENS